MEENFDQKLLEGMRVDAKFDEPILHQVIRIAIYDEFHAYETYAKVIERFGEVTPFSNILLSEQRHFMALIKMATKYNVPIPINNWAAKITIPDTFEQCCEVGVVAEIDNIAMYNDLLQYTDDYPDLTDVLFRLQAASHNNHLPAFRSCTSSKGDMGNVMSKMGNFEELTKKLSSSQATPQDFMNALSNTNLSFIGGALLGVVGTGIFTQMIKQKEEA